MSQTDEILRYMEEGDGITHKIAEDMFGCSRVAARIKNLRDIGVQIRTETIVKKLLDRRTSKVKTKRYAKYFLVNS